jgi:hypothetical protein
LLKISTKAVEVSIQQGKKLAELVRKAIDYTCHTSLHTTESDNPLSVEIRQEQVANQSQQINVKNEQIERFQSALDQLPQL